MRAIYSTVKKKVSRYSNISNTSLKVWANEGIVSTNEMMMLSEMAIIRIMSNHRPLGVSDSNMML
jgi:uracil DNA glycosylase